MNTECKNCSVHHQGNFKLLETSNLQNITRCKSSYTIKKGSIIFEEGEMLSGVYCIYEGVCKLTKLSSNGKSQIVRFVKKGEVLGQESVIGQNATNLTATAVKDMQVCFIPKEQILTSFNENSLFSAGMFKEICNELRKADNFIIDMAQKTVKQRLADALLLLKDTFGVDKEQFIDIQLSREEIGNLVGTATESLIRMLSDFSKNHLIQTKGKRIKIINEHKLKCLSEGNLKLDPTSEETHRKKTFS